MLTSAVRITGGLKTLFRYTTAQARPRRLAIAEEPITKRGQG